MQNVYRWQLLSLDLFNKCSLFFVVVIIQVAPNITAFGVPPTYLPQLTQVYSPRPGAVYVPAAATYDASARFDGHAVPVVPVSF